MEATTALTPFTVAGLDPEDTGTVTFTDANGKTVQVSVNGGQTNYTVNLSTLADGTITSSLAVKSDPAGNTFTPVAGNMVTLDQDSGEQAALKLTVNNSDIGASAASAVPFTIAGLDAEDTGVVTFTDANSKTVQVNVAGGQTNYTANLSTLADGSITSSLQVKTDPAGNSFTPVAGNAVTLDQDKVAETPSLTAPSSLTIAAGGSAPLGIVIGAVDSDDSLSVSISGVPSFESVSAAGATPTVTQHGGLFTYTFNALPAADWSNGLVLDSTYGGKGHPVNPLTVTVSNTTVGEASTAPSKTISVTDPPATTTPNIAQTVALFTQWMAAGFGDNSNALVTSLEASNSLDQGLFLSTPHHHA